jgi:hypothetical protein
MTIENRLIALLGPEHAARLWEKIKYWRQEQQWEKWREIKESITKNKRV